MAGFDGSAWDEEEEEPAPDHQYYNDFPGKEPPIGGVVDMRLREGAAPTPNHLGATLVRPWARPHGEAPHYKGDAGTPSRPWAFGSGLFHHESHGTCLPGISSSPGSGKGWGAQRDSPPASPFSLSVRRLEGITTPGSSTLLPKVT